MRHGLDFEDEVKICVPRVFFRSSLLCAVVDMIEVWSGVHLDRSGGVLLSFEASSASGPNWI